MRGMFALSVIAAEQLREAVDLGLDLPEPHRAASEESLGSSLPHYSVLKAEMQAGRSCKETARLAPHV